MVEGLGASYLSFGVNAAIRLVVTPFYLARLGAELMGFQSFIRETINYLQVMDLGLGTGLTAIVAKDLQPGAEDSERDAVWRKLRAGGQLQLLLSAIAVLLSVLLACFIEVVAQGLPPEFVGMARVCTVLFGLTFALYLSSRVYKSLLIGKQLISANAVFSLLSAILGAAVGVVLVAQGWLLYGLAVASVLSASFYFVQVRWRSRRLGFQLRLLRGPVELEAMRELAGLSAWVLLASAGGLLSLHSARLVLGVTPSQGLAVVNTYALLVAVPTMIRLQANRISVIVRPGLTQLAHSQDGEERARLVGRLMVKVAALLGAIGFVGIWIVNGAFVQRWVGPEYYAGDEANFLAAVLFGLSVGTFSFKVLMEVRFDYRRRGIGFFLAGVVTVVMSVALAPRYGLEGVLFAGIIGELVTTLAWFAPTGLRWLTKADRLVRGSVSLFSVPIAVAALGVVAVRFLGPISATWPTILGTSIAIAGSAGFVGLLWLQSDLRRYFRWG